MTIGIELNINAVFNPEENMYSDLDIRFFLVHSDAVRVISGNLKVTIGTCEIVNIYIVALRENQKVLS